MGQGPSRLVRGLALVVLAVATAACQITIDLSTRVERDGSGLLAVRFLVDRELVELARSAGEDPVSALGELPEDLTRAGWRIRRSTPGGGLEVVVERPFRDPEDLNRALEALERAAAAQQGPTARFFRLRVRRSSTFLRTTTEVSGSVDLTTGGLLGAAEIPPDAARQLQTIIEQTAGEFFRFTVRVALPGAVTATEGDPDGVRGGTAVWSPELGRTLAFRASASAWNPTGLVAVGVPSLALLAIASLWAVRRRGRGRPGPAPASPAAVDVARGDPIA
jgi:hypothetical protein